MQIGLLYFLHIPKTAGTSFMKFLRGFIPENEIFPGHFWAELRDNLPSNWEKYKLIWGHYGYGLINILPSPTTVITMLRDPVERTISHYHHTVVDPYIIHRFKSKQSKDIGQGTFEGLFAEKDFADTFANIQTKYLGTNYNLIKEVPEKEFAYSSINEILTEKANKEDFKVLLKTACQRLDEIFFFGLQEYFEQSYLLLAKRLHVDPQYDGSRNMVFEKRPKQNDLSDEVLSNLRKINQYDQQLYDYAKQRFRKLYLQEFETLALSLRKPPPTFDDVETASGLVKLQHSLYPN